MTLSAHIALFSLIVLAAIVGLGWILVIYVLSFHAAQWMVDRLEAGYAPRRLEFRPGHRRPILRVSRG
jgi:UPF0716 family protein affecting phage T7 exclusion